MPARWRGAIRVGLCGQIHPKHPGGFMWLSFKPVAKDADPWGVPTTRAPWVESWQPTDGGNSQFWSFYFFVCGGEMVGRCGSWCKVKVHPLGHSSYALQQAKVRNHSHSTSPPGSPAEWEVSKDLSHQYRNTHQQEVEPGETRALLQGAVSILPAMPNTCPQRPIFILMNLQMNFSIISNKP